MWFIGIPIVLGFALLVGLLLGFEIWMFVDVIKNPRLSDTEKLLWCLGMLFIHPIVAIVYFFVSRSTVSHPSGK